MFVLKLPRFLPLRIGFFFDVLVSNMLNGFLKYLIWKSLNLIRELKLRQLISIYYTTSFSATSYYLANGIFV